VKFEVVWGEIWSLRMALMAEERRRKKQNSNEREERENRGGRGQVKEKGEFARNDQNAPPILFRLFLVQAESFLLPLI